MVAKGKISDQSGRVKIYIPQPQAQLHRLTASLTTALRVFEKEMFFSGIELNRPGEASSRTFLTGD